VPVLKPGKPPELSFSYGPISLLSPAVKLLECLLLPAMTAALPKYESQHGYAPMHSTVTTFLPISTAVAIGFNGAKPAERSAVVALDISKAFDLVYLTLLIEEISVYYPANSLLLRLALSATWKVHQKVPSKLYC
jgi:hypothetical protein